MRILSMKFGDTKTLPADLSDRGAPLPVTPTAVTLKIANGMRRAMTMGASGSFWTYRFVSEEIAVGEYEAELLITWADGEETAPTKGKLKIIVEPRL